MNRMFGLLCVFLCCPILLSAGGQKGGNKKEKVIIYAALDEKTVEDLAKAFEEETGINVEIGLQIEQAGSVSGRIKTEAQSPRADVFIGGNSNYHSDLASGGFLAPYRSPVIDSAGIDPRFMDKNNLWTGWYLGALCLLYNTERFEKEIAPEGIAAPKTWDDLLNPAYQGEVIASNPATTGGAYLMMCAQIFRLGTEDEGFGFIEELDSNVAQYTKGANGSIPLVSQGEAIVGFAWGHDTLKQQIQGNLPITVVFPEETGYEIGAASLLKDSPNGENGKKFIDFLLSASAGEINARNGYRYPVRGGVSLPSGVPAFESLVFAEWDLERAASNVETWKKRWADITGK